MRTSVFALLIGGVCGTALAQTPAHFSPKGKLPSASTVFQQEELRKSLPLTDKLDFEEAKRGFIAAPSFKKIMADAGNVAWDMESYAWLLQGKDFNSIHPSLQRQAVLNMEYGLYEVVPGKIYQVRGFDLANISFVRGDTGWIIFDVGTTKETARAALEFINEKLGKRPVVAVVYSHAHADHFGGVRGVIDEADVLSGKVQVIAPVHFLEHAVSENVHAGPAMARRLSYQYGVSLPRNPFGHVDQAIGKNVAAGSIGLIKPSRSIVMPIEELTIDGVKMVFQNTPGTESPAEMNTWFPDFKAFWAAENITGTIHNIYTLRGALIRDPLQWSKKINEALYLFGEKAEVMFASHSWPRFGNARIQQVMRDQRDVYAHLNNAVLNLTNKGVTINEVHNVYKLPASLQKSWAAHSYHGSEAHNSRAVINRYIGYWDANPATLIPLSPKDSAPEYVSMMGGAKKIMARSKVLHDQGKYLLAVELLNKLVYAEPNNQAAKDMLADSFEQIGYQKESTSLRNSFLGAAMELRAGIPTGASPKTAGPDVVKAVPTELLLEALAIRFNSEKGEAAGILFKANIVTPDNGESFVLEVSNSTMTSIRGFTNPNADITLTMPRLALLGFLSGQVKLEDLLKTGKATLVGNPAQFAKLTQALDEFPAAFEIMPGTATTKAVK
jgi:alkyl sulfatase BDS1-like metallo-beta-lactamase superfamily hydrolase